MKIWFLDICSKKCLTMVVKRCIPLILSVNGGVREYGWKTLASRKVISNERIDSHLMVTLLVYHVWVRVFTSNEKVDVDHYLSERTRIFIAWTFQVNMLYISHACPKFNAMIYHIPLRPYKLKLSFNSWILVLFANDG